MGGIFLYKKTIHKYPYQLYMSPHRGKVFVRHSEKVLFPCSGKRFLLSLCLFAALRRHRLQDKSLALTGKIDLTKCREG